MGRPKKTGPPARVQAVIAHNLQVLIGVKYSKAKSSTDAHRQLANKTGTSLSQIQRAATGKTAVGVDTLERLADALGTRLIDLVTEGAFATIKQGPREAPDRDAEFHRRTGR